MDAVLIYFDSRVVRAIKSPEDSLLENPTLRKDYLAKKRLFVGDLPEQMLLHPVGAVESQQVAAIP